MTIAESEHAARGAHSGAPIRDSIELRVPSKPEYVAIVRSLITDIARRFPLTGPEVMDLQVAASEACANVVRHAYADSTDGGILVRCSSAPGRLTIEVADEGQGVADIHTRFRHQMKNYGGFGLDLIRGLMDDVSLDTAPNHGTTVRMTKRLPCTA